MSTQKATIETTAKRVSTPTSPQAKTTAGHSPTRRPEVPPTSQKKTGNSSTQKSNPKKPAGTTSSRPKKSVAKKEEEPKFWEKAVNGMNSMNSQFSKIMDNAIEHIQNWRED
ncbi:MAG: hypothetical protein FWE31_03400 [Firmicutes bacterium]|nr:hypothetical protein [Bacillota bacterium]